MKLKRFSELVSLMASPKFYLVDRDGDRKQLAFINDYGGLDGEWFIVGHEFGATHIVHASGISTAWDAWVDEQDPIHASEVHEAYDAYGHLRSMLVKRGNQDDYALRSFCNRWAPVYFRLQPNDHQWDLVEGYEYQSNATGTGIVDVGHYTWIRSADEFDIVVE